LVKIRHCSSTWAASNIFRSNIWK